MLTETKLPDAELVVVPGAGEDVVVPWVPVVVFT